MRRSVSDDDIAELIDSLCHGRQQDRDWIKAAIQTWYYREIPRLSLNGIVISSETTQEPQLPRSGTRIKMSLIQEPENWFPSGSVEFLLFDENQSQYFSEGVEYRMNFHPSEPRS